MCPHVIISIIYAVGSFIIIIIFTALLQTLFCTQHRATIQDTHHRRRLSISGPTAADGSHHRRTHSASFVANNNPIIPPNIATETSITHPSQSPTATSNPSRTRSTSFSISRRTSLPHAVGHLVHSMKSMLYQMEHRGYQFSEIQFVVRCAFILSCFGFLICVSLICIYFALECMSQRYSSIKVISVIFYAIGKYALYIGSSARLFYSLEGGVYQYHISVYIMIAIYFVIHLANTVFAIVLLYFESYPLFIGCVMIFYSMDVFYLILLYVLFTKQLLKVISNTAEYISSALPPHACTKSRNTSAADDPIQLQIAPSIAIGSSSETCASQTLDIKPKSPVDATKATKQKAYIGKHSTSGMEYVTKYSVLVLCSVTSSLTMSVMVAILGVAFVKQFNDRIVIHLLWCIDCVINSFLIYLYFIFGNWIYKRLCGICHNVTSKVCHKWMRRKLDLN